MTGISKFSAGSARGDGLLPPEKLTRMLVAAVLKNDAGAITNLVKIGADPNRSDEKGNTPLTIAATDPREHESLRALLAGAADPNVAGANGKFPLHSVLRMKEEKIMPGALELLLGAKANPNLIERIQSGKPMTALQVAIAAERSDKIMAILIQGGADACLGEDADAGVLAPLHVFARGGRYPLLELAFGYGADVDRRDHAGRTCLLWAAHDGMVKSMEMLLERGADPTAKDAAGKDAMAYARALPAESGRSDIMRMLTRSLREYEVRSEIKDLRNTLETLRRAVEKAVAAAGALKENKT